MAMFHPDAQTLKLFSLGKLPEHEALFVSAHLSMCPECKEAVCELDDIAGQALSVMDTEGDCEDLLSSTLAMLDDIEPEPAYTPPSVDVSKVPNWLPAPINQIVAKQHPNGIQWKRVLPHLSVTQLSSVNGYELNLHRIKAGGRIPKHTHNGREMTVLLQGGFSDSYGDYNEGDFIVRDGEHEHSPIAAENEECICLTLTEKPLKMTGWQWRWLNTFIK
jgi:putative transcriptional regulator